MVSFVLLVLIGPGAAAQERSTWPIEGTTAGPLAIGQPVDTIRDALAEGYELSDRVLIFPRLEGFAVSMDDTIHAFVATDDDDVVRRCGSTAEAGPVPQAGSRTWRSPTTWVNRCSGCRRGAGRDTCGDRSGPWRVAGGTRVHARRPRLYRPGGPAPRLIDVVRFRRAQSTRDREPCRSRTFGCST